MHAPAPRRFKRLRLARQRLQRALASGGKDHLAHYAFRVAYRGFGDAQQDAGFAAHLNRFFDQLFEHAPLGLHRDPVRDLDQQLDQAVDHFRLTRDTPEGQQWQTNPLRVTAQLPGRLDRGTPAKALNLLGMCAAQQVWRKPEAAQPFELGDLGKQALQADPARIGRHTRKSGSLIGIGQQCIQPLAHVGIQPIGDAP